LLTLEQLQVLLLANSESYEVVVELVPELGYIKKVLEIIPEAIHDKLSDEVDFISILIESYACLFLQ
jgi:hypothetical protein